MIFEIFYNLIVLGNKIDMRQAASEEELREALGLFETYGKEVLI